MKNIFLVFLIAFSVRLSAQTLTIGTNATPTGVFPTGVTGISGTADITAFNLTQSPTKDTATLVFSGGAKMQVVIDRPAITSDGSKLNALTAYAGQNLDISGKYITSNRTGTAATLVGATGLNEIADVSLGAGLQLSGGTLSATAAGGDILNGGNTEGATVTVGTNDAFDLAFETGGVTHAKLLTTGAFQVNDATANNTKPTIESTGVTGSFADENSENGAILNTSAGTNTLFASNETKITMRGKSATAPDIQTSGHISEDVPTSGLSGTVTLTYNSPNIQPVTGAGTTVDFPAGFEGARFVFITDGTGTVTNFNAPTAGQTVRNGGITLGINSVREYIYLPIFSEWVQIAN